MKFGWTRAQYNALTPTERLFILKQIETETVSGQEILQSTIELAIANVHRKKGGKHKALFKKRKKAIDKEKPMSDKQASKVKKALLKLFKFPTKAPEKTE